MNKRPSEKQYLGLRHLVGVVVVVVVVFFALPWCTRPIQAQEKSNVAGTEKPAVSVAIPTSTPSSTPSKPPQPWPQDWSDKYDQLKALSLVVAEQQAALKVIQGKVDQLNNDLRSGIPVGSQPDFANKTFIALPEPPKSEPLKSEPPKPEPAKGK